LGDDALLHQHRGLSVVALAGGFRSRDRDRATRIAGLDIRSMNLARADEIVQIHQEMIAAVERGDEELNDDFQERFMLLVDEFLKAVRE
jgi:hypothetical protein